MMGAPNNLENDPFWKKFPFDGTDGNELSYFPKESDGYVSVYTKLEGDFGLFSMGDTIELDSEKLDNYESIPYEGWEQELEVVQLLIGKGQVGNPKIFFISDNFNDPIVEMKISVFLRNLEFLREQFPYYWVLCIENAWILESRFAGRLTRGEFTSIEKASA